MEVDQPRKFNFVDTTATQRIFTLKKRIRAVSGGTSASKTISILIWCIDYCQTKQERDKIVSVISESLPHLKKGAVLDFQLIMRDHGYWNDEFWNETSRIYTFETGNKLEFYSVDTLTKARGPRRDVIYINEANALQYLIVDQLITRTRETVWLDWNPSEEFWFYTEMLNKRDDIDFMGDGGNFPPLTYLDNEALDKITIAEIESHRNNKNWWQVYGLGKLGEIDTRIYTGWQFIDEIPHEARLERYGLDFGYSNDPTAIVAVYKYNGGYILDEVTFRKGLLNDQIAGILLSVPQALVIADSAEPKSIDEIRLHDISILPTVKGKDSIVNGIAKVQSCRVSVTKRSLNLIKEYRNFLWTTDKNGTVINEPEAGFDHAMDAVRYAIASLLVEGSSMMSSHIPDW